MTYIGRINGDFVFADEDKEKVANALYENAKSNGKTTDKWDTKKVVLEGLINRDYYLFGYSSSIAEISES